MNRQSWIAIELLLGVMIVSINIGVSACAVEQPVVQSTPLAIATPTTINVALPSSATATPVPKLPTATAGIATTGNIRIFIIGYSPQDCGPHFCEHVHLYNCDSQPINIGGWKIKSVLTGDVFTFPSYVANPGCNTPVQFTVNTHAVGNESVATGIFTWNQPMSVEEWSPNGGKVELYDATGTKVVACTYFATPTLADVLCH